MGDLYGFVWGGRVFLKDIIGQLELLVSISIILQIRNEKNIFFSRSQFSLWDQPVVEAVRNSSAPWRRYGGVRVFPAWVFLNSGSTLALI